MNRERVKRSVSLAIHHPDGRVLLVQRPPDDEDLPLAWGLPAASLREAEDWEAAVRRAGLGKLGVDVAPVGVLEAGHLDRPGYRLEMRLYGARIQAGEPVVPRPDRDVTQYVDWRWGVARDLEPAARAGSLCSRLYLAWTGAGEG
jgi:8-oxo-dGTP diphosphatase